jgi:2-dehydropantoate 2-reductase
VRVAVMAAGAVGGYFGGRLAAAGHRDAIRRDGLKIESAVGDLDVNVADDPKQVRPGNPRTTGRRS